MDQRVEKRLEDGLETLAALPVAFSGCAGYFRHAKSTAADQAVLFVNPWGFEELSVRKFWRILADTFSRSGISSLRFDLPGTGNSLDCDPQTQLVVWQDAIITAAAELRRLSGASEILVVSQGLGAPLAATVLDRLGPLAGMAMLAPVLSGRLYLRELSMWARMTDGQPDPEKELREGRGFFISGFRMPDGIYADLRKLDLGALLPLPVRNLFVAARTDRAAETDFATLAKDKGLEVSLHPYEGYDRLVGNLNFSEQPEAVSAALLRWVESLIAPSTRQSMRPVIDTACLQDQHFIEHPVLIGPEGRLAATLCLPSDGRRQGATVVLLSTAYHPSAGWGRIGVETARKLAAEGVASLRFDSANTSDSPPLAGAPEQILYSPAQNLDVSAALDFIDERGLMPAMIAGRCSGGYLAFQSLLTDARLSGAVSANPYVFYWDGSQKVEDLLRFVPKPLGNYGSMLFKGSTWKRMISGEIAVKHAAVNLTRLIGKRMLHASETVLQLFPFLSREYREVHGAFAKLEARDVPLSLLYADDDPGIAHLFHHFGEKGQRMQRFRNVSLRFLTKTDHNLSTPEARQVFNDEVITMARQIFKRQST
jgi:hypothetical protein